MGIIIRQSFKASLSNYIGVIIGFASLIYFFPKFFTPSELGAIRLLIELGAIIGSFGLFGTTYSINRFFPYFKNLPIITVSSSGYSPFHYVDLPSSASTTSSLNTIS